MRSRAPDLLAAAAIAATMILLMLSTQGRRPDARAMQAALPSPTPEAVKPNHMRAHFRLTPRPPRQVRFHERAEVILDATGAPALDPNRGHDGPFTVTLLSRVGDAPAAAEPPSASPPPALPSAPIGNVASVSTDATPAPRETASELKRAAASKGRRAHGRLASRPLPHPDGVIFFVMLPAAQAATISNATRTVERLDRLAAAPHPVAPRHRDLKPGELILRSLRGPA